MSGLALVGVTWEENIRSTGQTLLLGRSRLSDEETLHFFKLNLSGARMTKRASSLSSIQDTGDRLEMDPA